MGKVNVKTNMKKGDRNAVARQIMHKQDIQRRRNYITKKKEIEDHEKLIVQKDEAIIEFEAQLKAGKITQKTKMGELETPEEMRNDITAFEQMRKDLQITLVFLKEDLFNITEGAGISIPTIEAAIKERYDEVNAFYDKNFKKA